MTPKDLSKILLFLLSFQYSEAITDKTPDNNIKKEIQIKRETTTKKETKIKETKIKQETKI